MAKIQYPTQTTPKKVKFSKKTDTKSNASDLQDIKLEIDELQTKSKASEQATGDFSVQLAEINQTLQSHQSQITGLGTSKQNVLTFDNAPTQNSSNPVTSSGVYTALSSKQDTLSAGSNITISGGVISATDTTYTAGTGISITSGVISATGSSSVTIDDVPTQNSTNAVSSGGVYTALAAKQDQLLIDVNPAQNSYHPVSSGGVYNALASKQDALTAGTGISISSGVISATGGGGGSCNCADDIASLQNAIDLINVKCSVLESKIESNSTQYIENIECDYDIYERELEIEGDTTVVSPNVLFACEPTLTSLDEEENQVSHYVKIVANIDIKLVVDTAGTYTFDIYDNDLQKHTSTIDFESADLNTLKTITLKSTYYTNIANHNLYVSISGPTGSTIVLKYQKMFVIAPNATILNKITPFDVYFNYYTNKYYLSDCTSGFAKLAEIDASNLSSTNDIVWTQTNIEAQNYKTYFAGENDNTTTTLGRRYAIITHKNNTCEVIDCTDNTLNYVAPQGTYALINLVTRRTYISLFQSCMLRNTSTMKYYNLNQNMTTSNTANAGISGDLTVKVFGFYNNTNYLTNNTITYNNIILSKTGRMQFSGAQSTNNTDYFQANHVSLVRPYVLKINNNVRYKIVYKRFDKFYCIYATSASTLKTGTTTLLGEFDDVFLGANNDYFVVKNNALIYSTDLSNV